MSIHNPYIYYRNNDSRAEEININNIRHTMMNNTIKNTIKNNRNMRSKSEYCQRGVQDYEAILGDADYKKEIAYLERHCRRLQIEVAEKEKNIMFLKEQQDRLQEVRCVLAEDLTCSICMDARKTHAFNLCGHLCVCKGCGERCVKCPICRAEGILLKIIM